MGVVVQPTGYTIANYCDLLELGTITVNRDYQRTPKVWPDAARTYLIDTILQGYPMPKLSLYQKTDVKTRRTYMEIVDGQQRSEAVRDFFKDEFRLTGKTDYEGQTFSQLPEEAKQAFLTYFLSVDLFVAAAPDDIRQMFKRINSYTVPLNDAEKRHAEFQGPFKWFIVDLTDRYADALKRLGVFSERQLSRMADAALFTEVVRALFHGIETAAKPKLRATYEEFDVKFANKAQTHKLMLAGISYILKWQGIHGTALMKPFSFYSLLLACIHCLEPQQKLSGLFEIKKSGIKEGVEARLSVLAAALEEPSSAPDELGDFVKASSSATNTVSNRSTRFVWMCRAIQGRDFL